MKPLFFLIISTFIIIINIPISLFATDNYMDCSMLFSGTGAYSEKDMSDDCMNTLFGNNEQNNGKMTDIQRNIEEINNSITDDIAMNTHPMVIENLPDIQNYLIHTIPLMTEFVWTGVILDYISEYNTKGYHKYNG